MIELNGKLEIQDLLRRVEDDNKKYNVEIETIFKYGAIEYIKIEVERKW